MAEDEKDNNTALLYQLLQYAATSNTHHSDDNENDDDFTDYVGLMNFYNNMMRNNSDEHCINDTNIRYPNKEGKLNMNLDTIFPRISINKKLIESATELNEIISSIYKKQIYIPLDITCKIMLYSFCLVPGIYNFEGTMSDGWSSDNGCSCRIVLDGDSSIIGGCFQEIYYSLRSTEPESSFEYEISNGTYNYINGGIEFTKWYFPFNYQYKAIGQIVYKTDEIWFKGKWQRLGTRRSGLLDMKLTNKTVVLEHSIKTGKYIFFGLSSWRKEDKHNVNMKIEVELMKHGIVEGMIYLFDHEWSTNYDEEEIDDGMIPHNEYSYDSHKIIDGEWHNYGKIVFIFDNNKEMHGFFNGNYYIGEWHHYNDQYMTVKYKNGEMFYRSSSVLTAYSSSSNSNIDHDINDNEEYNEYNLDDTMAANQMKEKYESRAKGRIGHFEFSLIEDKDKENKGKKIKLMQTARGAVVSVAMTNINGQNENEEDEEDEEDEENENTLFRNVSLDSDDNNGDNEDIQDIE